MFHARNLGRCGASLHRRAINTVKFDRFARADAVPISVIMCGGVRSYARPNETIMNVFDRNTKRKQKNRTALQPDYKVYEYLREEIGWRVADRIFDVKRKFEVAVDLGCWRGHVSKHALNDSVGILYQCEMAEKVLEQSETSEEVPTFKVQVDEEFFPFKANSLDLVISSLSLHWVNDLPGTFRQIHNALKNDGCFIGAMYGGDTLYELRVALQLAEQEEEGGFAPHVSPFTSVQDLGNLLNRAGYTMLTIDIDEMVVNFPSMYEVMRDLKGMGENNASWSRKASLRRKTQETAAKIYKDMYGNKEDGSVPATFQVIYFIGWKPDPSQKAAAPRGSGQVSIKDLNQYNSLAQQIENLKTEATDPKEKQAVDQISEDMKRLLENMSKDKHDK